MNIFNKIIFSVKHLSSCGQRDPERDWMGMLALSIIAFAGIVVWNIWTFDKVAEGGVIGDAVTRPSATVNRPSIDSIRGVFEKRATEEAKYVTGVYRYTDPSQ